MPLSEPVHIVRFRRELDATTIVVFRNIVLPATYFAARPGALADVMFKRLDDRSGCILLVDEGVRYLGPDQTIRAAFANAPRNGWRPLMVFLQTQPEALLLEADAYLGLNGRAPRPPVAERSQNHEIVVDAAEVATQSGLEARPENRFGTDLVEEARARRLDPPLFRVREIEAVVRILSKAGKNAVCLIGQPGVGKTAVVEGLAIAIAEGCVPDSLARAQILDVNLSMLAAGASYQNEFEGRMKQLLDRARRDTNTILFLDELHTISAPGSNASQMVKSDLGRGRIRCIGATTNTEYREIERDAALARRFQVVPVQELTPAQSIEILRAARARLEQHHRVAIPDDLLEKIVDLAARYVPERYLPDKALDLLDEACACARLESIAGQRRSADMVAPRNRETVLGRPEIQ